MPSINLLIVFLLPALFAGLATASPVEHVASAIVTSTPFTPAIEARDGVTNGWMNWYQTCRSCSLDPVRVVGWTNNVCRKPCQQTNPTSIEGTDHICVAEPVPESDKDSSLYWTSDNTQWIQPSAGYKTRCWLYT
jgi:hypothetical protein